MNIVTPLSSVASATTLEMKDVWFTYGEGPPALRGLSLSAAAGQTTMLVGVSGSGKTTLLKLAKGLVPNQRGTVRVLDAQVRSSSRARLDHRVAYIPQQLGLVRSRSVIENTLIGGLWRTGGVASLLGWFPRQLVDLAHERLRSLGIAHKANARVFSLSGGERQRVAIARALMQEPRVLLADEFTSQLDPLTAREILDIMRGIAEQGVTLVIATHQVELVGEYADRVVVVRAGEKVLETEAGDIRPDELTAALRS